MKDAQVVPLENSGLDLIYGKPEIFLLVMSKVFLRAIYEQLMSYINTLNFDKDIYSTVLILFVRKMPVS